MQRFEILLAKYLANSITKDEFAEFWRLFNDEIQQNTDKLSPQLIELWQQKPTHALSDDQWEGRFKDLILSQDMPHLKKQVPVWRYIAAAAVIFFCGTAMWWFYNNESIQKKTTPAELSNLKKAPGNYGAVLTLSNGKTIALDNAANGLLIQDANVSISKKDNKIIYSGEANAMVYNTVSTQRGKQWQLVLPDGTAVWLNSAASITYPVSFADQSREVSITGEVYFEVVHNGRKPFRVKAGNLLIEDVGTSFNVNAYPDEPFVNTALISGAVKLTGSSHATRPVLLKPFQVAKSSSSGNISVNDDPDVEDIISWKNGYFNFSESGIESIMRQISRWYDLDVEYEGNKSNKTFSGIVSRNCDLSQVLKIMEQAKIKFRLQDKKIIVMQ